MSPVDRDWDRQHQLPEICVVGTLGPESTYSWPQSVVTVEFFYAFPCLLGIQASRDSLKLLVISVGSPTAFTPPCTGSNYIRSSNRKLDRED